MCSVCLISQYQYTFQCCRIFVPKSENFFEKRSLFTYWVPTNVNLRKHEFIQCSFMTLECIFCQSLFFMFIDIDECQNGSDCHLNATCTNNIGSYTCACNSGFSGNGTICEGMYLNIYHLTLCIFCILSALYQRMSRAFNILEENGGGFFAQKYVG